MTIASSMTSATLARLQQWAKPGATVIGGTPYWTGPPPAGYLETMGMRLREGRFLKDRHSGVRVLGNGETVEKVTIQAHHVTPAAREKIEKAGGSIELLSENGKQ